MTTGAKGILIGAIINTLNEKIRKENKELCAKNLYWEQRPLHGGDMFFKLSFLTDEQIKEIAAKCGL